MYAAAASLVPSADDVIEYASQVWLDGEPIESDHVTPESDEVYIWPTFTTAASLMPSAEEVIDRQFFTGDVVETIHVAPESIDVYILPVTPTTAASFVPSADEVIEYQYLVLSRAIQSTPELLEVYIWPLYTAAASLVPSEDDVIDLHTFGKEVVETFHVAP